jgi:hypothetical protein
MATVHSTPSCARDIRVLATWIIRSKTSVSVMALALTSPPYNI